MAPFLLRFTVLHQLSARLAVRLPLAQGTHDSGMTFRVPRGAAIMQRGDAAS